MIDIKPFVKKDTNVEEWLEELSKLMNDSFGFEQLLSGRIVQNTGWDDLRIEPTTRNTGANAPTFTKVYDNGAGSRGVYLYVFDDSATEKEVFFTIQMPHGWAGTKIYPHVHWIGAVDDTTANPRWGLEYKWADIGEAFGNTSIVYTTAEKIGTNGATDPNVSLNYHYISAFAGITPTSAQDGISSVMVGRLFRNSSDAADTYNATGASCYLLYIDFHFEVNTCGSRTEYTK